MVFKAGLKADLHFASGNRQEFVTLQYYEYRWHLVSALQNFPSLEIRPQGEGFDDLVFKTLHGNSTLTFMTHTLIKTKQKKQQYPIVVPLP